MSEEVCGIASLRLNCGCCEDVYLECDRKPGHKGKHKGVIEGYKHGVSEEYKIKWKRIESDSPADNSAEG